MTYLRAEAPSSSRSRRHRRRTAYEARGAYACRMVVAVVMALGLGCLNVGWGVGVRMDDVWL